MKRRKILQPCLRVNDKSSEREHHTGQSSGVLNKLKYARQLAAACMLGTESYLFALEQGIEHETSVGECVARDRMLLLHTARIGRRSLAQVWDANVIIGAISRTILVIRADVRGRRVRKVVVDFVPDVPVSGGSDTRAGEYARISTSLVSNSATLPFRIPSACSERAATTCSSYHSTPPY